MATAQGSGIGRYAAVYVCLLMVTAAEFLVGYQSTGGKHMVLRVLIFGTIQSVLVVCFLMNLSSEKRNFFQFVAFFSIFVLLAMNYMWTDSFRLLLFRLTGSGPS